MYTLPPLSSAKTTPEVVSDGHLWIEEFVAGNALRFRLTDAGFLEFGDADGIFDHDAVPLQYRHAVRAVREAFDREVVRESIEEPAEITFIGVAVHQLSPADTPSCADTPWPTPTYDWATTPSVLGTDIYDGQREQYLPRDQVHAVFERVGLATPPPIEKERRAAHFDPTAYSIPESAYYDGPAAGIIFYNKGGSRAVRFHQATARTPPADREPSSPDQVVTTYVTDAWLRRIREECVSTGVPVTVEELTKRAVEALARETTVLTGPQSLSQGAVQTALRKYISESTDHSA